MSSEIFVTRGDTAYFTVELKNEDGSKLPLEVGEIIYFTVKKSIKHSEIIIQKIVTSFDGGVANIKIEPDDTKSLDYATYIYDIQWNKANGDVLTIIKPSNFIIGGEVTYE
jgi:hypothetical protein